MKKILPLFFLLLLVKVTMGQATIQRDPLIEKMVQQVSADSLNYFIHTLVNFGTRHTLSKADDPEKGIGAARNWVLSKFNSSASRSEGRMTCYIDTITLGPDGKRINKTVILGNVIAVLKGTNPDDDRVFLIGGHLDSRAGNEMDSESNAPGANDDASGVAAVLECARIMSSAPFGATIIFVAFSGEEQGLQGSAFLASKAVTQNWNIEAVFNNDIIGGNNSSETGITDNTRVRVFSEGLPAFETEKKATAIRNYGLENDGKARQLARYVMETGERYVDNLKVVLVYRYDRFLRGGDQNSFLKKGFTSVRITEMNENFDHQHQDVKMLNGKQMGDLPAFVDFEYLRKNTALNLSCLANLAKAPSVPQDVFIDVKSLTNSTRLSWKKPKAGNCKGFYVLMRETTSAYWQKKYYTAGTEMTLPYSKDNYLFAVQSVNDEGNESLPVVSMPKQ